MQSRTLDNSALIVLGMHRSGTSAVARVCNLLGVDLDPELMPAAEDNPTGFWEPREIVELHDSLLHAMGSSWDDPAPLPVGWEHSPAAIQTASRVQEVLLESFAGSSLWGIKDPRLCRLFPLWRPLLRQLGVSTKFLLVCREPVDTVASLRRRNGIATPKTALLWLRHVLGAEAASAASPRSVVVYERLLGDWQTTMRRVGADLGLSWKIAPEDADARVRAFLDTKLAHRGQSQDELPDHWVLSDEIRAVHQALIETSEGTGSRQAITLRRASE
ncbi:MAG TPA: hypothetical protein VFA48_05820, partial [Gammaproteobacteria bacterium]|nr:hypothetical protein [Gammaproteobacteria bacterium]